MMGSRKILGALAMATSLAFATPALAQDYTVSQLSGQYESPPATGVTTSTVTGDDVTASVSMPFTFSYYGGTYSSFSMCSNGFLQFGGGSSTAYTNLTLPQNSGARDDGNVCPLWDDLYVDPSNSNARMRYWTAGTAPNRRFIATWDGIRHLGYSSSVLRFQVKMYEGSGKIVFAYSNTGSSFQVSSYTVGIDEPGASRYMYPGTLGGVTYTGSSNTGFPTDMEFVPNRTNFTGKVAFDELVTTADGIAASTNLGVVPTGLAVELRAGAKVVASGFVDENGDFSVGGLALVSSQSGSLHLSANSLAANVSDSSGTSSIAASTAIQLADNVSFGGDRDFGTLSVDDTSDANGSGRAALQISLTMEKLRAWAAARTTDPIPPIYVFFGDGSTSGTSYSAGSPTAPAYIRIGGSSSSNSDAFDPAVIARIYARHVMASIAAGTSTPFEQSLDATTDATNALIEGFGLYLHTMTGGGSQAIDGLSANSAAVFDLETPNLSSAPSAEVGGWAGAALYDLIDADNEAHDVVDGTANAADERPFDIIDGFVTAPTPSNFLDAWDAAGHGADALVSNFIHHGLLADDGSEPNDIRAQASNLGTAGVRADDLTLNRFNEDWYRIFVPAPTDSFFVDVTYDRTGSNSVISLEVYSGAGSLIAVGSPQGDAGPVRAVTSAVGPEDIFVRVKHESGAAINSYTLLGFSRLKLTASSQGAWTIRRPINQPLFIEGGIPPYTLSVKAPTSLPRGMVLDSQNIRLTGSPLDTGSVTFTIQASDSGSPANTTTFSQTFIVNPELAFSAPALTGVAVGKDTDVDLGRTGGTDPVTVINIHGNMPDGLTIGQDFHIRGAATAAGGGDLVIDATDIAGSTASVDTTVIACGPFAAGPVELLQGNAAAGFYFDALAGSLANLSIKTAKKRAKRDLDLLLVDPDGGVVQGGVVKVKKGKAILKKVPLLKTGRYFLVFTSEDGGDASELNGSEKVALPKGGAGEAERIEAGDHVSFEFGAIEGATVTLKGKTTDDMKMRVLFLVLPDGNGLSVAEMTQVQKGSKYSLSFTCPQSGTYALYMTPDTGGYGDFKYKYKIKQPKGASFDFEE